MSTNFPGALDAFTNPTPSSDTNTLSHASQHANINDSVAALEVKVGITGSAVTTTTDYRLSEVISGDKTAGKSATQILTNKTLGTGSKILLGSDATGDNYYNGGSGVTTRVGIGSNGQVYTSNGSAPYWSSPSTA